mmetsp:Transcript_48687/g.115701  ORF Transcript_48687/g.115701 Transcript_48687/m.115701 type:complete len:88 (+) Transcript_48687:902-1165(+)
MASPTGSGIRLSAPCCHLVDSQLVADKQQQQQQELDIAGVRCCEPQLKYIFIADIRYSNSSSRLLRCIETVLNDRRASAASPSAPQG